MEITYLIIIFLCVYTFCISNDENDQYSTYLHFKKRRNNKVMKEVLKEIIGEDCIISTLKG